MTTLRDLAPRLAGVPEVAAALGVSPATVRAWRVRSVGFPEPVADLAMGPVWDLDEVRRWHAVPRPPGPRRPKGTA